MEMQTLQQANLVLAKYVPNKRVGAYSLDRMYKIMELLGSPQNKLKVIHVAGTSGKTSTSYFIAEMLKLAGKQVGLTVSPHIVDVNERVQINGQPLEEQKFCELLNEFMSTEGLLDLEPTYFELLVAFAYWVFAKEQVDYAVVEVGLGGLIDGTNVVSRADKICVVTDIGFDHTNILGNELSEIAAQKAGIIQPSNQVFMHRQDKEIMEVVANTASKQSAALNVVDDPQVAPAPLSEYQQHNWQLAKEVFDYVSKRDDLKNLDEHDLKSSAIQVPGRMDYETISGKTVIFDGAHNSSKMTALANSLPSDKKFTVVMGMVESKEMQVGDCIRLLAPKTARLICTSFPAKQDLPHHALAPNKIAAAAKILGIADVTLEEDPETAMELALQGENPILVTGSLFLVSHLKGVYRND